MTRPSLTHLDASGRARMVDVSAKPSTERVAVARGRIRMRPATLAAITGQRVKKGDVFTLAQIAGVMAAKRTSDLIPLCHPIALTDIQVVVAPRARPAGVAIEASVKTVGPTGVEMEALAAVAAAALTVYDMCKSVDRAMTIGEIHLVHKSGGRSGTYDRPRGRASSGARRRRRRARA